MNVKSLIGTVILRVFQVNTQTQHYSYIRYF